MSKKWKDIVGTVWMLAVCMSLNAQTITKYIEYSVPIVSSLTGDDFDRDYINRIPDRSREVWLQNLFNTIETGETLVYAPEDYAMEEPLSLEEVGHILNVVDTLRGTSVFTMRDTTYIVNYKFEAMGVTSIRFREQWVWTEDGVLRKEVLGLCFEAKIQKYYDEEYKTLFCIENEDGE